MAIFSAFEPVNEVWIGSILLLGYAVLLGVIVLEGVGWKKVAGGGISEEAAVVEYRTEHGLARSACWNR